MAISINNVGAESSAFATTLEVTLPTFDNGNLLVLYGFITAGRAGMFVDETGWTDETLALSSTGGDSTLIVSTKVADGDTGTITLDSNNAGSQTMRGYIVSYAGVDGQDATAVNTINTVNSTTHDPDSIVTNTDNAWAISVMGGVQNVGDPSATVPSGYNTARFESKGTGANLIFSMTDKVVVSAGTEDPGTWGNLNSGTDSGSILLALKPTSDGITIAVPTGPLR